MKIQGKLNAKLCQRDSAKDLFYFSLNNQFFVVTFCTSPMSIY